MNEQQFQKPKKTKTIGQYTIGKTIGTGTFGNVREGVHQLTQQKVSIKILNKNAIQEPKDKINLSRQIRILRKVRHPSIAQLLQTMETNNRVYFMMQLAEGGELFNKIIQSKKGRLTEEFASKIFQQLINAVEYLHTIGVAHRDIKPQNILLDGEDNIKIIDFGLSSFYQKGQKLNTSCGSPCYAAPQMLVQEHYNPLLADLWSCGIVLYAMVCGFLPFQQSNTKLLYEKIKRGQYEEPKHLSERVKQLISLILQFNPEDRLSITKIRQHEFCTGNGRQSIVRGLIPGQTMKLQDQIINHMNDLGLFGFRDDVQKHKNTSHTAVYFLLLYQYLKQKKISLNTYIEKMQKDCEIKSPYKSKSMILRKHLIKDGNTKKRSSLYENDEEGDFLEKIFHKNRQKVRERSCNLIRIRKVN